MPKDVDRIHYHKIGLPMFNFQDRDRINCEYYDCNKMQREYLDLLKKSDFEFDSKEIDHYSIMEDKDCWRQFLSTKPSPHNP